MLAVIQETHRHTGAVRRSGWG